MKLAQRVVLSYYRTKLKAVEMISPAKAAEMAFDLFCTPYSGKPKRKAPPIFERAIQSAITVQAQKIILYRFLPKQHNGKKVLICHGFDSCAYKFHHFIQPINQLGFEVILFDAPGHGNSGGKNLNALLYKEAMLAIANQYGPFNVAIAHSLGGLALSLAVEEQPVQFERLVLIAPATETQTAIRTFFQFLPVQPTTQSLFNQIIVNKSKQDVQFFSTKRALHQIQNPTLWIHDENDEICPLKDVEPLIQVAPPHIEFLITQTFGHNRIYRENKVKKAVLNFISPPNHQF